jgi:hypothetical protein
MDWTDSRQEFHSPRVLPGADLPRIGRVTRTTDGALPWRVTGLTADAKEIDNFLLTLATNDCSPRLFVPTIRPSALVEVPGRRRDPLEHRDAGGRARLGPLDAAATAGRQARVQSALD